MSTSTGCLYGPSGTCKIDWQFLYFSYTCTFISYVIDTVTTVYKIRLFAHSYLYLRFNLTSMPTLNTEHINDIQ